MSSTVISGYWKDTGNVADMLEVNRMVLESMTAVTRGTVDAESELIGRVVIEEGATVTRSRVVGPVIIGAGTQVTDSYVGPFTALAEDCVISGSRDRVLHRAAGRVHPRGPADRGLARSAGTWRSPRRPNVPRAHRLVLGDHSQVQISSS